MYTLFGTECTECAFKKTRLVSTRLSPHNRPTYNYFLARVIDCWKCVWSRDGDDPSNRYDVLPLRSGLYQNIPRLNKSLYFGPDEVFLWLGSLCNLMSKSKSEFGSWFVSRLSVKSRFLQNQKCNVWSGTMKLSGFKELTPIVYQIYSIGTKF